MDRFKAQRGAIDSVAFDAFAITPVDATPLAQPTRAIYVGTAGNITVKMISYDPDDDTSNNPTILFKNVPAGAILPIRAAYVMLTGTTATDLVGLF